MAIDENMIVIGPGERLGETRNALGISRQEVAQRLNLTVDRISKIEVDDYDGDIPLTFIRGYLRSYAALVELSADEIIESFNSLTAEVENHHVPERGVVLSSMSLEKEVNSNNLWFKFVSLIIFTGILVLIYLAFKDKLSFNSLNDRSNTQQQFSDSLSTEQGVVNDSDEGTIRLSLSDELTIPEQDNSSIDSNSQLTNAPSGSGGSTENIERSDSLPQESNDVRQPSNELSLDLEKQENEQVSANQNEVSSSLNSRQNNSLNILSFSFSGDCWVRITDKNGAVLAVGVKTSGRVMNLEGLPPFNIVLGNPSVVELKHRGKEVDLSEYPASKVARFTISP